MAKDPVCGMDVDEKDAAGRAEHKAKRMRRRGAFAWPMLAGVAALAAGCAHIPREGYVSARMADYFATHGELSPAIAAAIERGHVLMGMDQEQVQVYQLSRRWFVGARYDWSERAREASVRDRGASAVLTFWPSEFNQVRGQYRRTVYGKERAAHELLFQVLFTIGAHGAHPF